MIQNTRTSLDIQTKYINLINQAVYVNQHVVRLTLTKAEFLQDINLPSALFILLHK